MDSASKPPVQTGLRVAVLAPCRNEAVTIAKVIADFHTALPDAAIYVYDNASTDDTAARAEAAGAEVRSEKRRGKGNVVHRMFADVSADVYVLVDGDDTYDAAAAPLLIEQLVSRHLDMAIGLRRHEDARAYRPGHQFGNWLLTSLVNWTFGAALKDMLSGYRVMSRRFVKSFPALSSGFEIETELTVHALDIGAAIEEIPTAYKERPEGSASKLHSLRDGARILRLIARLVRDQRPIEFFTLAGAILLILAAILGVPVILEYLDTGLVPRQPTWLAAVGLVILAFLSFACGVILDGTSRNRREARRLAYLAQPVFWD